MKHPAKQNDSIFETFLFFIFTIFIHVFLIKIFQKNKVTSISRKSSLKNTEYNQDRKLIREHNVLFAESADVMNTANAVSVRIAGSVTNSEAACNNFGNKTKSSGAKRVSEDLKLTTEEFQNLKMEEIYERLRAVKFQKQLSTIQATLCAPRFVPPWHPQTSSAFSLPLDDNDKKTLQELHEIVKRNDGSTLAERLNELDEDKEKLYLNCVDNEGRTLLFQAIDLVHPKLIALLTTEENRSQQNNQGFTPLYSIIQRELPKQKLKAALVKQLADSDIVHAPNRDGCTALQLADSKEYSDIVEILSEKLTDARHHTSK